MGDPRTLACSIPYRNTLGGPIADRVSGNALPNLLDSPPRPGTSRAPPQTRTGAAPALELVIVMQYDRTVIAYHGCDIETAHAVLDGEPFKPSINDYDWLGHGIYFWEYGADRAWRFAQDQQELGKARTPAVIGALIQLGNCFDLLDTRFTHDLREFFPKWRGSMETSGAEVPRNLGSEPDWKGRYLDCAVINAYLTLAATVSDPYDTVRGCFREGGPAYPGAGIHMESHIQVAVRNPTCILGVFRPMGSIQENTES